MTLLADIVRTKREELRDRRGRQRIAEFKTRLRDTEPSRPFLESIAGPPIRLIAEIKKASPSAGVLRPDFDPVDIAKRYEAAGARALSILTDQPYFQGSLDYLAQVRKAVTLPLLQKDFVLDEVQLYEARALGADAVLLIAAILELKQIRDLYELALGLGLSVLTEVHSERELESVVEWAPIIGINNRDLTTFAVDLETTFRVIKHIPKNKVIVSESGIGGRKDIERLAEAGVHAVLIGETFMRAENIGAKVKELMGT
ncbi:MAG: indole-3-glycerol phosphate synthase TrpC [Nitrospirae bacterium]|nr:indole-3-glycerol phosphate synthase TrpC [Nitrospirota bacterium]